MMFVVSMVLAIHCHDSIVGNVIIVLILDLHRSLKTPVVVPCQDLIDLWTFHRTSERS